MSNTEKEIINNASQDNQERIKSILDSITDAYYEVDLHGKLIFCNRQLIDLYGYSMEETIGMKYTDYMDKKTSQEVFNVFNDVYKTGKPSKIISYSVIHKSGEKKYIEISVALIKDLNDNITGFRGIARDVTEFKTIELALIESEKKLRERNSVIEWDLENARIIQKSIVSAVIPKIPGIKIECRYLPLDAVGGDYFSITPLSEGGIGVFIGDVSNHGVSAALFLSLLKAMTDRVCRKFSLKPKDYLTDLNKKMTGNMPMSFLTCIYGLFEHLENRQVRFTFSKAGHPQPILHQASTGNIITLKAKGTLIGMFEDIRNDESSIVLSKGDRLYLYTDGLPEAANINGGLLGFEALPEIIKETNSESLKKTLDLIIEKANEFKGITLPFQDDIILIGFEIE